jgi:hypothetical protein
MLNFGSVRCSWLLTQEVAMAGCMHSWLVMVGAMLHWY